MASFVNACVTVTECPNNDGTRSITFKHNGAGRCCWKGGTRKFRIDRYGIAVLVDSHDQSAELIGCWDDSHERCYGDSINLFTRQCLKQIYS